MHRGYVKLWRKIIDSELMDKPPLWSKLWNWMLVMANRFNGGGLAVGQFHSSIDEMREAMSWHVGYRKVTPTKQEIRKAYEGLAKATMINTAKTTRGMIITIVNFATYQGNSRNEEHSEEHSEILAKDYEGAQDKQELENKEKDSITSPSPKVDPCPHQAIVEIYHEILPELPAVKIWTDKRKALLRSRWKEDSDRQSLDWWRTFFTDNVKTSDFLTGKKSEWKADLEWILKPTNFVKVLEGRYKNSGKPEEKSKLSVLMQAY